MIKEIKLVIDGFSVKTIEEAHYGACTGCVFLHGTGEYEFNPCKNNKKTIGGFEIGKDCYINSSIFEKCFDTLIQESNEPRYTVDEVLNEVLMDNGDLVIQGYDKKYQTRVIKQQLKIINDPEYMEFIRLSDKFSKMTSKEVV